MPAQPVLQVSGAGTEPSAANWLADCHARCGQLVRLWREQPNTAAVPAHVPCAPADLDVVRRRERGRSAPRRDVVWRHSRAGR